MAYSDISECLPTRLNPLAERTGFSQVAGLREADVIVALFAYGPPPGLRWRYCPGRPGRLKGLSVFHSKLILYQRVCMGAQSA
jgi:hypothetical protein